MHDPWGTGPDFHMLSAADKADYLSDEDSDDEVKFDLEIPLLDELVNEFEKDDEEVHKIDNSILEKKREAWIRHDPPYDEINDVYDPRQEKVDQLNQNIDNIRKEWKATLPTIIQEMNSKIKDPRGKIEL